jgi:hypothetical protein
MSRRTRVPALLLATAAVVGCNLFAPGAPSGFAGWFHLQRPDRATSILFAQGGVFELRDLGCTEPSSMQLSWEDTGTDGVVVPNLAGPPVFTSDGQGDLIASPAVYTTDGGVEVWHPGASCFICGGPDAGPYACDNPSLQNGGP